MFAAMIIASRGTGPLEQVINGWRTLSKARGAFERLETLVEGDEDRERLQLPRPNGVLNVSHLSARPPGNDRIVLNDVSFKLDAGRVLGVVGQSGAGKSCLARVLVGAWVPLRGTVTLDGNEISHWDQDDLGQYMGFMPQDVDLLPGTIAENIARFRDDPDQTEKVLEAATLAGVEELIQSLPDGYNTQVGPRGHVLSGGQRQRIALARAVYGSPSFVVLDEPNSNLDANGEEALGRAIEKLRERGATVVVITHKMNLLTFCQEVLVLHEGALHAHSSRDDIISRLPGQRPALRAVGNH
jgi:ABC-type protease/lipase transport system fused ATPase/permease subunit